MNKEALTRPLSIDEIDFRVQSINKGGYATILAYKDARVDMNRLDEAFGIGFWQRRHDVINGNLFCSIGVWNEEIKQWVWVQDVGVESMAEKEKGQASDSFKRAGFNLHIGRELYDYPVISVKLIDGEEWKLENGKPKQQFGLKLREWKWFSEFTDGKISYLGCRDQKGVVRFQWGKLKNNK